jgi:hypothetical protein
MDGDDRLTVHPRHRGARLVRLRRDQAGQGAQVFMGVEAVHHEG